MNARAIVRVLALGLPLLGCGGPSPSSDGSMTNATTVAVTPVAFQSTTDALGAVAAVTEFDGGVAVFSDAGALVLVSGAVASSDASVKSWRGATSVPSPDGTGTWVVGLDGSGHVQRLRAHAILEDATDRYALGDVGVQSIAALGGARVAFGFDGGFAVADGAKVTRYAAPEFAHLVGAGNRVATLTPSGVSVFDASSTTFSTFALAGVVAVAIASDGTLLAATSRTVYLEKTRGDLTPAYASPDADLHAATASGTRFWLTVGTELLTLGSSDSFSPRRTSGANIAASAQLAPGASEAVWTLAAGVAQKLTIDPSGAPTDEATWRTSVQPIFGRVCSSCHLPGGSAGFDLSTYSQWVLLAPKLQLRVMVKKDMPPPGTTLADDDRATIGAWLHAHGQ